MKFSTTAVALMLLILLGGTSCKRGISDLLLPEVPPDDVLYPYPTQMPERTEVPLPELLSQYEQVVQRLSPEAYAALQPGLTTKQLDELETQYDIVLHEDIRQLYKWHNGSDSTVRVDAFPYMRFVPLDEALKSRELFRTPDPTISQERQEFQDEWLGFRYAWVGVLENGAGDGYYYDPDRRGESACFFFTAHDDIGYMFYPSIGNYIEELLELDRRQELTVDELGIEEDSERTFEEDREFMNRYGQWVE